MPRNRFVCRISPGFPGSAQSGGTLDELHRNLQEVIGMLLEDGEPLLEGEFVGPMC